MLRSLTLKLKFKHLFLLMVLTAALAFRVIALENSPSGLHADEASFLLNAQSILETGQDEDGRSFPISLNSLIDPKPALYSYLQIPFVAIFGATITASRLPAVLLGCLSLLIIYFLLGRFERENLGLLIVFLLAISPWHIVVSRATQEVIMSFFFLCASFYALIAWQQSRKKMWLLTLGFTSFLAMYSYHAAKVFLPLFVACWMLYCYQQQRRNLTDTISTLGVIIFSALCSVLIQESGSRFAAVGLLNYDAPAARILEQIYNAPAEVPNFVLRFFYNKPATYGQEFISQYLEHFNPNFLFMTGGEPKRYLVPFHGLFYYLEIPFLLLGLYLAARNERKPLFVFFLLIILLAPIPAALTTQETPSMIRIFPLLLGMMYFIAEGLWSLINTKTINTKTKWKIPLLTTIAIIYMWHLGYFSLQFFVQQKTYQPWYRNNPYMEIAQKLSHLEADFDKVIVTNDLRPLYTYFVLENLVDISQLQDQPLARGKKVYQLGKYEFNRKVCYLGDLEPGKLYIAEVNCRKQEDDLKQLTVVETITYPDGTAVYELLTFPSENEN